MGGIKDISRDRRPGKKKSSFCLIYWTPRISKSQFSIYRVEKNIELFKSRSALFRPVCPKFENANFWGKNLVKLEIGPLEKILRGVEKEEVGRN